MCIIGQYSSLPLVELDEFSQLTWIEGHVLACNVSFYVVYWVSSRPFVGKFASLFFSSYWYLHVHIIVNALNPAEADTHVMKWVD